MPRSIDALRVVAVVFVFATEAALAGASPADMLERYVAEARAVSPGFGGSSERGKQFFRSAHANDWSCATCHTDTPLVAGRHATTGKSIVPLAPVANAERFTDAARVEKWFKRNCNDVLDRPCTPQEKADVLTFLLALPTRTSP